MIFVFVLFFLLLYFFLSEGGGGGGARGPWNASELKLERER